MESNTYTVRDFLPLIVIGSLICAITALHQTYYGWHLDTAMRIFMAAFFLVFGFFKAINLGGFAKAYAEYDLIARQVFAYGYAYPFIEIGLGLAYLYSYNLHTVNMVTLVVMLIGAAGVFNELRQGKQIACACLGVLFKIPMTYVTLAEDLIMAAMAALMLLHA